MKAYIWNYKSKRKLKDKIDVSSALLWYKSYRRFCDSIRINRQKTTIYDRNKKWNSYLWMRQELSFMSENAKLEFIKQVKELK